MSELSAPEYIRHEVVIPAQSSTAAYEQYDCARFERGYLARGNSLMDFKPCLMVCLVCIFVKHATFGILRCTLDSFLFLHTASSSIDHVMHRSNHAPVTPCRSSSQQFIHSTVDQSASYRPYLVLARPEPLISAE